MSKHPAAPTTEAWRMFYDSYDKGTMFIGPDVDTAVAEMLDPTEAGKIVAAHNAALAEARAAARKEVERGFDAHRYSWVANTADDWKCSCGYFGNFSWSGWALHFLDSLSTDTREEPT